VSLGVRRRRRRQASSLVHAVISLNVLLGLWYWVERPGLAIGVGWFKTGRPVA